MKQPILKLTEGVKEYFFHALTSFKDDFFISDCEIKLKLRVKDNWAKKPDIVEFKIKDENGKERHLEDCAECS